MLKRIMLSPLALFVLACEVTDEGAGRRECPHDWDWKEIRSEEGGPQTIGATISVTTDTETGISIQNVPEFHDCQRFIVRGSSGFQFDALVAIFASFDLDTLEFILDSLEDTRPYEGPGTVAVAAAEIVALADGFTYPPLKIRQWFNCLYLYHEGNVLRAKMVNYGHTEVDCRDPIDPRTIPASQELLVSPVATTGFTADTDYPPVARWDWDNVNSQHYIGIKCRNSWCEIASPDAFSSSMSYASQIPTGILFGMSSGDQRTQGIKGWYDQQILAIPQGGSVAPGAIVGTIIPNPLLGTFDAADFDDNWIDVAEVALSVPQNVDNPYKAKFNFAPTSPGDRLNAISLCSGKNICPGVSDVSACVGSWWAKIRAADDGSEMHKCIERYPLEMLSERIPGTARWRWLSNDEGGWMRCGQGCCELH